MAVLPIDMKSGKRVVLGKLNRLRNRLIQNFGKKMEVLFMKKFLAGVLCAGLVFSMTACSSQSSSSQASGSGSAAGGTETYQVSFICPNTSLSYWSDVREGLEQGAEEFGVELDFVGPSKIDTESKTSKKELN